MMRHFFWAAALFLSACGYKGDLYLPQIQAAPQPASQNAEAQP